MRIAVYTISKNEEKFAKRFMECIKDEADGVFVTDTGSTDKTIEILRAEGAIVNSIKVTPWRFDVARQISMNFVPADYDVLVCIDLDEILSPGWRAEVEKSFADGQIDRLRYQYVWNFLPDGREGITFWYDKIHTRHGFRWVKPVHEVMDFAGPHRERQGYNSEFKLYHHPDPTKSRGSYLGLLELATKEAPEDDRSSHYLGREYMYYGMNNEAITELSRHLKLESAQWRVERAASMRFLGRCFDRLGNVEEAHTWFLRSCAEASGEREPWVELGKHYYYRQMLPQAYFAMSQAIAIEEKPATYICEPSAWGEEPFDIASVSAYQMGMKEESLRLAKKALEYAPDNERIAKNVESISNELSKNL